MKYIIVSIFIIVYLGFNKGYCVDSPLINHIIFNFSHVNWIHLVLNSLAYIGVFRTLQKTIHTYKIVLLPLLVSFLCSFYAVYPIPTMGASGMIYAMIGMFFAEVINGKLVINDKKMFDLYILSVVLALVISFFNHHSNFKLHILCLVIGLVLSLRHFGKPHFRFM